jgi:hypothetical protein
MDVEFARAKAFARDIPIEFARAKAFARDIPIEFARAKAFARDIPVEFARAKAFARTIPIIWYNPFKTICVTFQPYFVRLPCQTITISKQGQFLFFDC